MQGANEVVEVAQAQTAMWMRRAALMGDAQAQAKLGNTYSYKDGDFPHDYVQAYMWTYLAVEHGDQLSKAQLSDIESKMTADQIAQAQKLAHEWKPISP